MVEARYCPSLFPVDTAVKARLSSSIDTLYSSMVPFNLSTSAFFDSTCSIWAARSLLSLSSWSVYRCCSSTYLSASIVDRIAYFDILNSHTLIGSSPIQQLLISGLSLDQHLFNIHPAFSLQFRFLLSHPQSILQIPDEILILGQMDSNKFFRFDRQIGRLTLSRGLDLLEQFS
jgi:hypothetical protein